MQPTSKIEQISHPSNEDTINELKAFVSRIEDREEAKAEIAKDISFIYKQAEAEGFNVKALREVIRLRKKSADERDYEEELRDLYLAKLGMK